MNIVAKSKRVLVVASDPDLRQTRVLLVESKGHRVDSVATDDEAVELLKNTYFDLILLGRDSRHFEERLDQRIRQMLPKQLILKIQPLEDAISVYPSRTVDPSPEHVINALSEMLRSS